MSTSDSTALDLPLTATPKHQENSSEVGSANIGPAEVMEGLMWVEDVEDDEEGLRPPVEDG
ncbi:hypothetical protein TSMEX_008284 [Taenia solium]|eukprot:TsM_001075400 transcript=TsM_001075400 gene=TsM_001075400